MKFKNFILSFLLPCFIITGGLAYALGGSGGIDTEGSFFNKDGVNILTNEVTDEIGSSSSRVAKVWTEDFDTNTLSINIGIGIGFTEGSALFANSSGNIAQDNANFFWDDTNNRLGIGTATPATALDVNGGISSSGDYIGASIIGGTGTTSDLNLKTTNGVGASGADMHFLVGNNGATEAMTILNNGNVGIGTNSPSRLLSIKNAGGSSYSSIVSSTTSIAGILFGDTDSDTRGRVQYDNSADSLDFYTAAIERMMIDSSGNVGIGTTTPNQKLTIEGTMSLKEQASANAYTAGYGQIWVKSDTPNTLWFTDDAGTDVQIGGGGGGGASKYDATVCATGCDYTTLRGAVIGGAVVILVQGNTTETGSITLPNNAIIECDNNENTINMGQNSFLNSVGDKVEFNNCTISNSGSSSIITFNEVSGLYINNCTLNNGNTSVGTYLIYSSTATSGFLPTRINQSRILAPNVSNNNGLVYLLGQDYSSRHTITDSIFVGAGSSTSLVLYLGYSNASNVSFNGTFSSSLFTATLAYSANMNGVTMRGTTGGNLWLSVTGNWSSISGVNVNDEALRIYVSGQYNNIHNISSDNASTVIDTSSAGSKNTFTQITTDGVMTMAGDNNSISQAVIGAGGGSSTITINSGADNNIIIGSQTDSAISDSGIGTTTSANVVF